MDRDFNAVTIGNAWEIFVLFDVEHQSESYNNGQDLEVRFWFS